VDIIENLRKYFDCDKITKEIDGDEENQDTLRSDE